MDSDDEDVDEEMRVDEQERDSNREDVDVVFDVCDDEDIVAATHAPVSLAARRRTLRLLRFHRAQGQGCCVQACLEKVGDVDFLLAYDALFAGCRDASERRRVRAALAYSTLALGPVHQGKFVLPCVREPVCRIAWQAFHGMCANSRAKFSRMLRAGEPLCAVEPTPRSKARSDALVSRGFAAAALRMMQAVSAELGYVSAGACQCAVVCSLRLCRTLASAQLCGRFFTLISAGVFRTGTHFRGLLHMCSHTGRNAQHGGGAEDNPDIVWLPASLTIGGLVARFRAENAGVDGLRDISRRSWCRLMRDYMQKHIRFVRPGHGYCDECAEYEAILGARCFQAIMNAVNWPELERYPADDAGNTSIVQDAQDVLDDYEIEDGDRRRAGVNMMMHLICHRRARRRYRESTQLARKARERLEDFESTECRAIATMPAGEREHIVEHLEYVESYTFDFSAPLRVPQTPHLPSVCDFTTTRSVRMFGVRDNANGKMVVYLFWEYLSTGNPNSVISLLNDFLTRRPVKAPLLFLHADNCARENRNKWMMKYLCWLVISGEAPEIRLQFFVEGHGKNDIDGAFGRIKQKYRKHTVYCMKDVVEAVGRKESEAGASDDAREATCVRAVEVQPPPGRSRGMLRDWKAALDDAFPRDVSTISRWRIMRFSAHRPGRVVCLAEEGGEEREFTLVSDELRGDFDRACACDRGAFARLRNHAAFSRLRTHDLPALPPCGIEQTTVERMRKVLQRLVPESHHAELFDIVISAAERAQRKARAAKQ